MPSIFGVIRVGIIASVTLITTVSETAGQTPSVTLHNRILSPIERLLIVVFGLVISINTPWPRASDHIPVSLLFSFASSVVLNLYSRV